MLVLDYRVARIFEGRLACLPQAGEGLVATVGEDINFGVALQEGWTLKRDYSSFPSRKVVELQLLENLVEVTLRYQKSPLKRPTTAFSKPFTVLSVRFEGRAEFLEVLK